jgi:hypothetical protein
MPGPYGHRRPNYWPGGAGIQPWSWPPVAGSPVPLNSAFSPCILPPVPKSTLWVVITTVCPVTLRVPVQVPSRTSGGCPSTVARSVDARGFQGCTGTAQQRGQFGSGWPPGQLMVPEAITARKLSCPVKSPPRRRGAENGNEKNKGREPQFESAEEAEVTEYPRQHRAREEHDYLGPLCALRF